MYNSIPKSKGLLFVTNDLSQMLQATRQNIRVEVDALEANRLLNTAPEELKKYLVEKNSVAHVALKRDEWYADTQEVQVDVRYDSRRWIDDTSRPVLVPGERVEVRVPFDGEAELFYAHANTWSSNPPRGVIQNNELILRFEFPADQPADVRPNVDRTLKDVEEHLGWQRPMIDAHNAQLPNVAEEAINSRRARLLAQSERAEALGIPIRRRTDAPTTYALPASRKKAVPTLPPAASTPYRPEPTWPMEQYEQALKIMQDMALVMERSPEAFKTMGEEDIRQHFLVQLNGQFEGKVTGETFNMSGKTDILLREGDRNAFIAECKFWKGPKAFAQAIDQLLNYATWRDSKLAILVFNRGIETSTVLAGIDTTAKAHSNFKRAINWPHDSGFRYIFHSNGDANREMTLTILVFHVPK
ncbi:hypothetical protein [Pseudoduganella sp. R-34]|uniref:hypothetical protein n=1 Tax=Pseudoduganella sp. R-34 TaxID=3404062 RepID=UPI003CEC4FCE